MKDSYYANELAKINAKAEYPPNIVITDGNGSKTKHLNLNKESAKELIKWLNQNFK